MLIPENLKRIIKDAVAAILPPPNISVSEWADANRFLPETANEAGRYRSERTPFVIRIMNSYNEPVVEEISVKASAQCGKTTAAENIIGYTIDVDPQPILFMAPTKDVAKIFSKEKLTPMLESTPSLRDKVAKRKSRDSDNTALYKRFVGGFIVFVGANSPHGLRQMSIPIIISDDINSIEIGATKEGDPVERAEKRSQTFEGRRKKIRLSTPTIKGESRITYYFERGTMERFYIRCLECNHQFIIKFENIVWPVDKDAFGKILKHYPEQAQLCCLNCGSLFGEAERLEMIYKTGEWIAEHPERVHHRSFHINELSSTLSSLKTIARSYVDSVDDPEKLETFTNLVLGEDYEKERVEENDPDELMQRLEDYIDASDPYNNIPNKILFVVSVTDVQKDRLEVEHWGCADKKEMFIIGKATIEGDPEIVTSNKKEKTVWNKLDDFNAVSYKRKDGFELKIVRKFIDSGYLSNAVYEFCRYREAHGIWPIKGRGQYGFPVLGRKYTIVDKGRTKLIHVGTNTIKDSIFRRLKIEDDGARKIHFTECYCNRDYFDQLTAEVGTVVKSGNIEITVYKKKKAGIRNEALDLLTYAVAAVEHYNPNFELLKKRIERKINAPDDEVKTGGEVKQKKIKRPSVNPATEW